MGTGGLASTTRTILFSINRPLRVNGLTRILSISRRAYHEALLGLSTSLSRHSDNVYLLELKSGCRLSSQARCTSLVHSILRIGGGTPLSGTTFRILTIVTCGRPIAGTFMRRIENISYSNIVSALYRGELIRRGNELRLPNEPLMCKAAPRFLHYFNIRSLSRLPRLPGGRPLTRRGRRRGRGISGSSVGSLRWYYIFLCGLLRDLTGYTK